MYGIVNKAIEDLVRENFGDDQWEAIKQRSQVDIDFFLSNEPYDDAITYQLAQAAADVTGMSIEQVLIAFGEWWILRTGKEKYGGLMHSGGTTFAEFMHHLPLFHNRVMLIYPHLTPPEFQISDETDHSLKLHYFSKREGLQDFVRGLIQGLGKMFNTSLTIELLTSRQQGHDHETFLINW